MNETVKEKEETNKQMNNLVI